MVKEAFIPNGIFSETEKTPSAGIAMVIVGIEPNKNGENITNPALWTNIERKPKPATDRLMGQISFPSDTRKIGEGKLFNMLGTLAEFTEDDSLIKRLSFMPSSYTNRAIQVKENYIDLMVVFLSGLPTTPITPLDKDEVIANGWMQLGELQRLHRENPSMLRSFVGQIIGGDFISRVIDDYFKFPQERILLSSVVDHAFSIANFYRQREQLSDVIGNSGVIYVSEK